MSAPDLADDVVDEDSFAKLEVAPGDILAGKYRVMKVLGAGGMGVVVQATHTELDEIVAMKFLNPALMERDDRVVERFKREAKTAAKIKGEHVARVRDIGTLESGAPYIVMEYLDGEDLSDVIERLGRVRAPDAVLYILQACEALAQAHAKGIVHRDLKPPNLFLASRADGSPTIKVLDFGISKILSGNTAMGVSLTKTNVLIGSPLYMPPECWQSAKNADERSDIWSLGAILFELLGGAPPFPGDNLPEVCRAVQCDEPPMLSELYSDVRPALDEVIGKALAKSPSARYQNIAEFAVDLAKHGRSTARMFARRVVGILEAAGKLENKPHILADSEDHITLADTNPQGSSLASSLDAAMAETAVSGEIPIERARTEPTPPDRPSADGTMSRTNGIELPRKSRVGWIAAGVALVASVGIAFALQSDEPTTAESGAAKTAATTAAPATSAPEPVSTMTKTAEPVTTASATVEPSAAPVQTGAPQPKVPTPRPIARPQPQPNVQPKAQPKVTPKPKPRDDDVFGGY